MPEEFDPRAMVERFRARATAVRSRGIPPIEGPDRQRFIEQAQLDFMDYAMIGDAEASIEDGFLTLRVDLRPRPEEGQDRQPVPEPSFLLSGLSAPGGSSARARQPP